MSLEIYNMVNIFNWKFKFRLYCYRYFINVYINLVKYLIVLVLFLDKIFVFF